MEFAREELRRRRWRRRRGGVVPGACTSEDIADMAITDLLQGRGRLAVGFTWEKILAELKRLASQHVRALHGLKENGATRSEWEAGGRNTNEGEEEEASVFDEVEDASGSQRSAAAEANEALKQEILEGLDGEMQKVFECVWEGTTSPAEMARRLGMEEAEAVRIRKRLQRRLAKFRRKRNSVMRDA